MKVHEALHVLKSFDFIANTHTAQEMIKLGAATACIIDLLEEMDEKYLMHPHIAEVFLPTSVKGWDWAAYNMKGEKLLFKGDAPIPVKGEWKLKEGSKKKKIQSFPESPVMNYKDTLRKLLK